MIKGARKQSSDPIQEKLRSQKSEWNTKKVSPFIDNLIHFKWLMNGTPSKFNKAKSPIGEPIPADPLTIVSILASDFNEIAEGARDIARAQVEYSKNRRRKRLVPSINPNQLTLPIDKKSSLNIEASNKLTRFLSHLKGPYFGSSKKSRERKFRLTLLSAMAEINKELKILEHEIVKNTPESIIISRLLINKINDKVYIFVSQLNLFSNETNAPNQSDELVLGKYPFIPLKELPDTKLSNIEDKDSESVNNKLIDLTDLPPSAPDNDVVSHTASAILTDPLEIKADIKANHANIPLALNDEFLIAVKTSIAALDDVPKALPKQKEIDQLISDYKNLINHVNSKLGTNGGSLREILLSYSTASEIHSNMMEVFSNNLLSKWLNKSRHMIGTGNTSALRLELYDVVSKAKTKANEIMNSLEKALIPSTLESMIQPLIEDLAQMDKIIKPLELFTGGLNLDNAFISSLEKGNRLQNGIELDDSDRDNLRKAIRNREIRKMVNMKANK
jgi:hypothetical protein